ELALQRDPGLGPERLNQLLVPEAEAAAALVEQLKHADRRPVQAAQRAGEQVARVVAGLAVHLGVEARVGVGVRDVDDGPAAERLAGDAAVGREADLARRAAIGAGTQAGGDAAVQLVAGPVVEEYGAPLAVEHAQARLADRGQERAQLG